MEDNLINKIKKYIKGKKFETAIKIVAAARTPLGQIAGGLEKALLFDDLKRLTEERSEFNKKLLEYQKNKDNLLEEMRRLETRKLESIDEHANALEQYLAQGGESPGKISELTRKYIDAVIAGIETLASANKNIKERLELLENLFTTKTSKKNKRYISVAVATALAISCSFAYYPCGNDMQDNKETQEYSPYTIGDIIEYQGKRYRHRSFQEKLTDDQNAESIVTRAYYVEYNADADLDSLIRGVEHHRGRKFNTAELSIFFNILARENDESINNGNVIKKETIDKYNNDWNAFRRLMGDVYGEIGRGR